MQHIASFSGGKDSTAMVLELINKHYPLDEVVMYDTGMEFQATYDVCERVRRVCEVNSIKFTTLHPPYEFVWKAFEKPVHERNGGFHYGYSWCGGRCRWGTRDKLKLVDDYAEKNNAVVYIGIAADETARIEKERKAYKRMPLVDWCMTESDCLRYCYKNGIFWEEDGVLLYDILDRVSCWCCANKNRKELMNIYRYLPKYWQKLKDFQSRTERPMKKFSRKGLSYGDVFVMEKVFEREANEND